MVTVLLGVAVVVVVRWLPPAGRGDVDPAGLTVGLVSLAAALWSGWMAVQAARWQETDLAGNAGRLAVEVMAAIRAAWRQLLGARDRTVNVPFVHHPALAHEAASAAPHDALQGVAGYDRRPSPGRPLITGVPGAARLSLALQLMLLLLEYRSPGDPVPVRLSLSSFDTKHPLEEWTTRRGFTLRTARAFCRDGGLIGRQIHPGGPSELIRTTRRF
ncbi:hypothetical protein [Streptomyces scopuliridis]|uniref:hypothetical protein n=1 Tax=Streptomyces scopuliridis TaxID=452529 RepID=UPI0036BF11F8